MMCPNPNPNPNPNPPKRKKWSEPEEKTLMVKYGEMVCDGSLGKMKTREKKFRPIACYVNSVHHARDPIAFPWFWTWKDVSTKVQNMRHQYLLVKQKIKKPDSEDDFDWLEGLTHWSNFLRYKEVFGDVPIANANGNGTTSTSNDLVTEPELEPEPETGFIGRRMNMMEFGQMGNEGDGDFSVAVAVAEINGVDENGVMGLGFDYEGEEAEENYNGNDRMRKGRDDGFVYEEVEMNGSNSKRKKKTNKKKKQQQKKKKRKVLMGLENNAWGFLGNQLGKLRELEAHFEQREVERQCERQRRESARVEIEKEWEQKWEERETEREEHEKAREKLRKQIVRDWEVMGNDIEERERRRREEELFHVREQQERINRRRSEWKTRIDEMLSQHRAEMDQIQTRILHEQQNLTSQVLGIVSQWTTHPTGLSDHTSASNHYLSQMMQNLHHVNGMVHGDARVEGDNQDDQFIVDG
ncbi:uncharacterized protein LOC115995118 isoform X1 [Quercus lobata]|nr:uncharacterized protein LOC115995118 isoform X1 [Quercus lobata]